MNSLFGDATSVMPTPETLAEAELLFSGMGSPVPSLDIRGARGAGSSHAGTPIGGGRQKPTADGEIPRLEIDAARGGAGASPGGRRRPSLGARQESGSGSGNGAGRREGVGGWISDMIARTRGGQQQADSESGSYRPVGQRGDGEDDDDDGHYEVGDGDEEGEGGGEQRAGGARGGYAPVDAAGTARRDAGGGAT
jgi:hypothetical protein